MFRRAGCEHACLTMTSHDLCRDCLHGVGGLVFDNSC